jgi:hypothetical protein
MVLGGYRSMALNNRRPNSHHYRQFKLHSYPWCAEGAEAVSTRILLLNILQTLETHGFRIYASIDQSSGVCLNSQSLK